MRAVIAEQEDQSGSGAVPVLEVSRCDVIREDG